MTDIPIVVVQGADSAARVPGIEALAHQASFRFAADARQLARMLPGADVLLGWSFKDGGLREAWPAADRLRWIHWSGAGVDALLFPALARSEVMVTNARGVFDRAIAETVLALILAFAKSLPRTALLQAEHRWEHRDTERIDGKQVLVVGAGSIGRAVARLLRAVGMRVAGVSRRRRDEDPDFGSVRPLGELRDALGSADFVVCAAPLTAETEGMFGANEFASMARGARFINIGRGAQVDEQALIAALREGIIAGAALDVFQAEPLPEQSALWDLPGVIVSPHMSGDAHGWREEVLALFADNLARYRSGRALRNLVDKHAGFAAD